MTNEKKREKQVKIQQKGSGKQYKKRALTSPIDAVCVEITPKDKAAESFAWSAFSEYVEHSWV